MTQAAYVTKLTQMVETLKMKETVSITKPFLTTEAAFGVVFVYRTNSSQQLRLPK